MKPVATIVKSAVCRTSLRHRPCPTLFYFPGLEARPVWDHAEARARFPWMETMEDPEALEAMREEFRALRQSGIASDYSTADSTREQGEHKLHDGDWSWHSYISKGKRQAHFAASCPRTVDLLESGVGSDLMVDTPFSFAFFSTLHPESSIAAHAAPCNLRLRFHLPLVVPSGPPPVDRCGMRVAATTQPWEEGRCVVFDDSYEHEVWNHTKEERVVLLFDVWHPDLTMDERLSIIDMFDQARQSRQEQEQQGQQQRPLPRPRR